MSAVRREPDPLRFCPFPKHLHEPWERIVDVDRPYLEWLVGGDGPLLDPALEEKLVELLEGPV